jgi:Mrp family chromosome partitioning ATPase
LVLVDAGSVLESPEAAMAAGMVDAVLLVARPSVSTRSGIARAAEQLKHAGGRLIGSVLVGSRSPEDIGIMAGGRRGGILAILGRSAAS